MEESRKPSPAPRPAPRRGLVATVTVLSAVLVLALAAAVYFGLRSVSAEHAVSAQNAINADRTAVLADARRYALDLSSYDYRSLDKSFGTVENNATNSFAHQYQQLSAVLGPELVSAKSVAKGTVLAEAVQSVSADQAVVLVFVDQSVTNSSTTQPQVNHNRMQLTLAEQGGNWLIDNAQLR